MSVVGKIQGSSRDHLVVVDLRESERAMKTHTPKTVRYAVRKTLNDAAFILCAACAPRPTTWKDRPHSRAGRGRSSHSGRPTSQSGTSSRAISSPSTLYMRSTRNRGIIPVIPHKANDKNKPGFFAKALYRRGRFRALRPRTQWLILPPLVWGKHVGTVAA